MLVDLAYGQGVLTVRVPDDAVILQPEEMPGLPNEPTAIRGALRAPIGRPSLAELVKPSDRVAVVFSDITRPMPNARVVTGAA